MEIRHAHPTEAAGLTEIAVAAKRYWHYPEALMQLWLDSLQVTPARIAQQAIYVAILADQVIGFYALIPTPDPQVYELDDLWIRPDYIGQGIGSSSLPTPSPLPAPRVARRSNWLPSPTPSASTTRWG